MPTSARRWYRIPGLLFAALVVALHGRPADGQAIVKVSDAVSFKVGVLLQPQADWQEVPNAANDASGGYQQNLFIRRARFILGGQVAKNVFFFMETENANLGKSTQPVGGTSGAKAPGTGFSLLDAVGEWRIAKAFNVEFGEIRSPVSREGLKSAPNQFMLDTSAYAFLTSTALQNQSGRDTGFMFRGFLLQDRLEYRSAIFSGFRQPGVKNSFRFVERLQYNFFDTEVYALPSYAGVNYGNKKILAVGAAYDTQGAYQFASADMYLDIPIPIGSFESTIQWQYADGETFLASLPEENTFQVEAGVFARPAKLGAIVRYEQKTFTQTVNEPKNEKRFAVGVNFYPVPKAESNFNIKVWWQRVSPKVGYSTNEFTLQFQVYYF
jgi:hypothetical protein